MSAGLASMRGEDGDPMLAVLYEDQLLPLDAAVPAAERRGRVPVSLREALADWERWSSLLSAVESWRGDHDDWMPLSDVELLPAVGDPPNIYCAGANYYDHIAEMGGSRPDKSGTKPFHFLASRGSLSGHRSRVARPVGSTRLDWEVELAVVIGSDAREVPADRARQVIAGYTVANDLSLRDLARRSDISFFPDWLESKCHAGCLPLGPAVVPASAVADPMRLGLTLTVNGVVRQSSSTERMIFSIYEQIEYLSCIAPLCAGDVILTGTPAGTGIASGTYLRPGDVVVAEVEGIGRLESTVVDAQPMR